MHVYTFNLQQKFWSPHEEAKWASKLAKKYSVFLLLRSTFQPSVEKPKKNIKATNKDNIISQWEHGKTRMTKSRLVFRFASDWLRGWRKFSGPIREMSYVKPNQSQVASDTKLKIAVSKLRYQSEPIPIVGRSPSLGAFNCPVFFHRQV